WRQRALPNRAGDSVNGSMTFLASDERSPAIVVNPGAASPFLLLGDHAGREIPRSLCDLGIHHRDWDRHIAWDIGVAGLGDVLSEALGATFIRQRFSRLVIDCNRDPARPDAIPEVSDGTHVPGNVNLTPTQRQARIEGIAAPYHAAIAAELDARAARGGLGLLQSHPGPPPGRRRRGVRRRQSALQDGRGGFHDPPPQPPARP